MKNRRSFRVKIRLIAAAPAPVKSKDSSEFLTFYKVYLHRFKINIMTLNQQVRIFKWVSIFEGISFLLLLFIAMPLKYIWDLPQMVEVVGMFHGILFVAYVLGAVYLFKPLNWNFKTLLIVCLSSVLPFGPFYVEKKYL
ncbi:hypothetical protein GCM10007103_12220 [Salinimicrobium marinum]|uniref:DUF3817 domain-containing protein n=2 Tax=Salinimicrobium marinum TaxID=680283 RepID=A0A918SA02_9FLAO|nr:hypothetical protein GCM10007103_12220 [Salinimicrobium marinum]